MDNLKKIPKTFLFLSVLSGVLWMGSYLTRLFLSYQLFNAEDMSLKSYITGENIGGIMGTLLPAVTTHFILYITFILVFILFLATSKVSLKQNGWLFITAVIVFVTMPFEVYLMTIDYDVITQLNSGSFDGSGIAGLFRERIQVLSSFPVIEILSYFAVVFLYIFKPLQHKKIAV